MRPAWAHSCGCKSRRKLITTNEVNRNCMRVTECGEEAWIVICEPMNKNWIEGAAEQGERANDREALVIKAKWRKSGGCAEKECVLTWGDLASRLKGRRMKPEREVSRGRSSYLFGAKGRRSGRCNHRVIRSEGSQMFLCEARHISDVGEALRWSGSETINFAELEMVKPGVFRRVCLSTTSTIPTARCGPACRVVWEGRSL